MALRVHLTYREFYGLPLAGGREIVDIALVGHGLMAHSELVVFAVAFDAHGNFCVWGDDCWGQVATDGGESTVVGEGNSAGEFAVAFGCEG